MAYVDFPSSSGEGEKRADSWIHIIFVVVVVQAGATEGQEGKANGVRAGKYGS